MKNEKRQNRAVEFFKPSAWKIILTGIIFIITIITLVWGFYSSLSYKNSPLSFGWSEKVGDVLVFKLNLPVALPLGIMFMPIIPVLLMMDNLENFIDNTVSLWTLISVTFIIQIVYWYLLSCIITYLITKIKNVRRK